MMPTLKDKDLNLEEIETSHTLGGVGEGRIRGEGSGEDERVTLLQHNTRDNIVLWSLRRSDTLELQISVQ